MTVPPGGLCDTTVHVDTSLADPDLEQLLAQLLRMLSRDALTGAPGADRAAARPSSCLTLLGWLGGLGGGGAVEEALGH